ncbi:MAG: vWA domain-containing protein, partial [bacterium]
MALPSGVGWAVHEETDPGEIESRPAPVSRRECVGGTNAGALCNENADCPGVGAFCQDRNVYNVTVSVRFNATAAQLTTIQNDIYDMAASLFDVTDGQAQVGQVTILNNSSGAGGTIWVTSASSCSGGCFCADSGHWASGGKIYAWMSCLGGGGAGEAMAHEFVHLVFDARDEYEARAAGCGGVTGAASCPVAAGEEGCLMDVGGLNGGGTELCWGQGNPADPNDVSGGNHDPTNVTEQSRCRSNRSCWDQIGHSWPTTFKVPAGAPDPEANGLTVDPVVFLQPAATARIVLVLDNSGSMAAEGPPNRLARLKTAALDFVNLAQNGIELGLVSFSTTATDLVALAPLGADRSAYVDAINDLTPT